MSLPNFAAALADHALPELRRAAVTTLQVNAGKRCDLACHHCHVEAGPKRTEALSAAVTGLASEAGTPTWPLVTLLPFLARPDRPGTFPIVVLMHERYGLVKHSKDLALRAASDGVLALAPKQRARA